MAASNRVLIVGSVALDSVETPLGQVTDALGGSAVYASVAANYYSPVSLLGVVGDDFPEEHVAMLNDMGIDTSGLQVQEGQTFRWRGRYDHDVNQAHTIATHLNVFESFRPELPASHREADFVFLANIDPELQLSVLDQVDNDGALTFADTMNFWIETKREELLEVFRRVNVVFINDAEARELCETSSLIRAGNRLLEMGPEVVVIKKGEHGALMFHPDQHFAVPSYPLMEVCDPTGAGDSFAGGFIGSLASEPVRDPAAYRRAAVRGSVVASYNVEDFSLGRLKSLSDEELHQRFLEFQRFTYFE